MSSPYRESSGPSCPHCKSVLGETDESFACPAGCGEWLSRHKLVKLMPLSALDKRVEGEIWWKLGTGSGRACPTCNHRMHEYGSLYEYCGEHGAWVPASQRNNFRAKFADAIGRAKQTRELKTEIENNDTAALAARIVALEHEVSQLRYEMIELARRLSEDR